MSSNNGTDFSDWCFFKVISAGNIARLSRLMYSIYAFVILGVFTNFIAFVGSVKRAGRSSAHLFMAVLAVTDMCVLVNKSAYTGLNSLQKYRFSNAECIATSFAEHFLVPFSAWLLILMTSDRAVAICLPLRAHQLCTVKKARIQIIILAVVLVISNLSSTVWMYKAKSIEGSSFINCVISIENIVLSKAYESIMRSLESYVPFIIITILNAIMAAMVRRSARLQAEMTQQQMHKKNDTGSRVTAMVIVVSIAFLLFTGPYALSFLVVLGFDNWNVAMVYYMQHCDGPGPAYVVLYLISHGMFDANYVVNGIIYSFSSQFRRDVMEGLRITRSTHGK